jgi:large subunit ribosomal protein L23
MKEVQDPFDTVKYVLMTEKPIRLIETENKLTFIVNRRKNKTEIKNAIEKLFEAKVSSIWTLIDKKGRKKATVKFKEPGTAGEIAMRLGII